MANAYLQVTSTETGLVFPCCACFDLPQALNSTDMLTLPKHLWPTSNYHCVTSKKEAEMQAHFIIAEALHLFTTD